MPCCATIAPTRKLISTMIGTLRSRKLSRWKTIEVKRQRRRMQDEPRADDDDPAEKATPSIEIGAGGVDALADVGEQRVTACGRARGLGRLDRTITGFAKQDSHARAARRDSRRRHAARRRFCAGGRSPRRRRCPSLDAGKIDRARCARSRLATERRGRLLERRRPRWSRRPVSGRGGPLAGDAGALRQGATDTKALRDKGLFCSLPIAWRRPLSRRLPMAGPLGLQTGAQRQKQNRYKSATRESGTRICGEKRVEIPARTAPQALLSSLDHPPLVSRPRQGETRTSVIASSAGRQNRRPGERRQDGSLAFQTCAKMVERRQGGRAGSTKQAGIGAARRVVMSASNRKPFRAQIPEHAPGR